MTRRSFSDFPFSPARFPFFYGWVIVGASTVGMLLSLPGQTMGVSVFTDHLIRELRLSRSDLSSAYMHGTIASACLLPLAGRLFDRLGARAMIVISSLGLGAALLFLSATDHIARSFTAFSQLLGFSPSAGTANFLVLGAGFFAVRFWGQGVVTMVSRAMLGKWFDRLRGFASALSGVFVSAGFSIAPRVLLGRIATWGWRGAWVELACIAALWALLGGLLYRDNPEECGLEMDGGARHLQRGDEPSKPRVLRDFTLHEALRTYGFWLANLSIGLFGLLGTAATFHITSIGAKAGVGEAEAVAIFVPMAVVSVATNFVGGWLSDWVRIRNLFWALLAAQALACAGLLEFGAPVGRWLVILGFGTAGGLFTLLSTVIWPRFYGRAHLGSIAGASTAITVLGSALGPHAFALVEAADGSYDAGFLAGAAAATVLLLGAVFIENPQHATPGAR